MKKSTIKKATAIVAMVAVATLGQTAIAPEQAEAGPGWCRGPGHTHNNWSSFHYGAGLVYATTPTEAWFEHDGVGWDVHIGTQWCGFY